jgi:hypothetical protein
MFVGLSSLFSSRYRRVAGQYGYRIIKKLNGRFLILSKNKTPGKIS